MRESMVKNKEAMMSNEKLILNTRKLFDDGCSICIQNFEENQKIIVTPCNHAFHESCMHDWISSSVEKALK